MKVTKTKEAAAPTESATPVNQSMILVPLEQIISTKSLPNRTIDNEHVKGLTQSISQTGLDVPLLIWGGENPGDTLKNAAGEKIPKRVLIAGGHRREAIRSIQSNDNATFKKHFGNGVPCIITYGELSTVLLKQLRENVQRKNPTQADVLPFVKRLRDDFNLKGVQIAKRLGMSPSWVSQVLDIDETLGEDAEKLANEGATIRESQKATKEVKQAKKEGKGQAEVSEIVEKHRKSVKARKGKGLTRAEKRPSLERTFKAYKALPAMSATARLKVLEGIVEYDLKKTDELPEEIEVDSKSDSK